MTIELKLNEQKLQGLVALLDAGVKATGLQGVKLAAELIADIDAAVAEARKAQAGNVITLPEASNG